MDTRTGIAGLSLAAAAASLFALVPLIAGAHEAETGKCMGSNSCKGTSACKTENSACKGQNACKGQGFEMMTESQCEEAGGSFEAG